MFHCFLTYFRYMKRPNSDEAIVETFHIEEKDEKTIKKVGCALSGLLQQMGIEHNTNFVYTPDRRS